MNLTVVFSYILGEYQFCSKQAPLLRPYLYNMSLGML